MGIVWCKDQVVEEHHTLDRECASPSKAFSIPTLKVGEAQASSRAVPADGSTPRSDEDDGSEASASLSSSASPQSPKAVAIAPVAITRPKALTLQGPTPPAIEAPKPKPVPAWRLAAAAKEAERSAVPAEVVKATHPRLETAHSEEWEQLSAPVLGWVAEVIGVSPIVSTDIEACHAWLKSGVVLCALVNKIQPGIVAQIEQADAPFPQRENIVRFLRAASALGVHQHELFQSSALFDMRDMRQVVSCLGALGRASHSIKGYTGPRFGKPVRARLGAHKASAHLVSVGEGRWGTAACSQHRPIVVDNVPVRTASATGFLSPQSAPAA